MVHGHGMSDSSKFVNKSYALANHKVTYSRIWVFESLLTFEQCPEDVLIQPKTVRKNQNFSNECYQANII